MRRARRAGRSGGRRRDAARRRRRVARGQPHDQVAPLVGHAIGGRARQPHDQAHRVGAGARILLGRDPIDRPAAHVPAGVAHGRGQLRVRYVDDDARRLLQPVHRERRRARAAQPDPGRLPLGAAVDLDDLVALWARRSCIATGACARRPRRGQGHGQQQRGPAHQPCHPGQMRQPAAQRRSMCISGVNVSGLPHCPRSSTWRSSTGAARRLGTARALQRPASHPAAENVPPPTPTPTIPKR